MQWNGQAVGGDDEFQMLPDVAIERVETLVQMIVIVGGQVARMRLQRKSA